MTPQIQAAYTNLLQQHCTGRNTRILRWLRNGSRVLIEGEFDLGSLVKDILGTLLEPTPEMMDCFCSANVDEVRAMISKAMDAA
jgi:hypothetical protein